MQNQENCAEEIPKSGKLGQNNFVNLNKFLNSKELLQTQKLEYINDKQS